MLTKLMQWVAKIAVGQQLIAGMAWVHNALDGHRSEIILGVTGIVHILKLAGVVPANVSTAIEGALLPLLPLTLADKASKVIDQADAIIPTQPVTPPTPPAPPAA